MPRNAASAPAEAALTQGLRGGGQVVGAAPQGVALRHGRNLAAALAAEGAVLSASLGEPGPPPPGWRAVPLPPPAAQPFMRARAQRFLRLEPAP